MCGAGARVQHTRREHRGQRRSARGAARLPAVLGARARRAAPGAAGPAALLARPALLPGIRTGNLLVLRGVTAPASAVTIIPGLLRPSGDIGVSFDTLWYRTPLGLATLWLYLASLSKFYCNTINIKPDALRSYLRSNSNQLLQYSSMRL